MKKVVSCLSVREVENNDVARYVEGLAALGVNIFRHGSLCDGRFLISMLNLVRGVGPKI